MESTLKIKDACKQLNVSRQTIYNWITKDIINAEKLSNGSVFIIVDEKYNKIKTCHDNLQNN